MDRAAGARVVDPRLLCALVGWDRVVGTRAGEALRPDRVLGVLAEGVLLEGVLAEGVLAEGVEPRVGVLAEGVVPREGVLADGVVPRDGALAWLPPVLTRSDGLVETLGRLVPPLGVVALVPLLAPPWRVGVATLGVAPEALDVPFPA